MTGAFGAATRVLFSFIMTLSREDCSQRYFAISDIYCLWCVI